MKSLQKKRRGLVDCCRRAHQLWHPGNHKYSCHSDVARSGYWPSRHQDHVEDSPLDQRNKKSMPSIIDDWIAKADDEGPNMPRGRTSCCPRTIQLNTVKKEVRLYRAASVADRVARRNTQRDAAGKTAGITFQVRTNEECWGQEIRNKICSWAWDIVRAHLQEPSVASSLCHMSSFTEGLVTSLLQSAFGNFIFWFFTIL